jgi:hypothetical protein
MESTEYPLHKMNVNVQELNGRIDLVGDSCRQLTHGLRLLRMELNNLALKPLADVARKWGRFVLHDCAQFYTPDYSDLFTSV